MYDKLIHYFFILHFGNLPSQYLAFVSILGMIVVSTIMVNFIVKSFVKKWLGMIANRASKNIWPLVEQHAVLSRVSQLCAGIFFASIISYIAYKPLTLSVITASALHVLALVYVLVMSILTFNHVLDATHSYSKKFSALHNKPIRSYFQILKIAAWIITSVCIISLLVQKSPMVFLTGLGAISAVALLVFKDTILGFVASIQVSAYDSVRVGDWITIKDKGVDGNVLDVAVNSVKVQNFDNTIITIPTYDLINTSVQNWRGMTESGGRRIKRSILIDINSIKFCNQPLYQKLSRLHLLNAHLSKRGHDINTYNTQNNIDKTISVNGRQFTNIGLFRAYIETYLKNNPDIHTRNMTFLVRQLQSTPTGLPLEVYVFTKDTKWEHYENIQDDIFDHLFAALSYFELKAFQFSTAPLASPAFEMMTE